MVFDTKDGSKHEITDAWYDSSDPNFSNDGKYLVFVSSRDFSPTYGDLDWNVVYNNMQRIYLVMLNDNSTNPFAPQESYIPNNNSSKEKNNSKNVNINFNGIKERLIVLPIRPAYYWNVNQVANRIYYNEFVNGGDAQTLYCYDLNKKKETEIAKNVNYQIKYNSKKMLINKGKKFAIINIPQSQINFSDIKFADLSGVKYITDYTKEYKEIFKETWYQMKDFFFDPNMRGLNWDSIYTKYSVLVPYVHHRNDLTYILGEMIGELNIGHAYVGGGDRPKIQKIYTGQLGAKFVQDKSGYFKITKILRGPSWTKTKNSPLAIPGLNVKKGDFIVAINGIQTNTVNNIYQLLVNTAGVPTELTINTKPSLQGAKKVVVVPLKTDAELYYYNWVQHNLNYVSKRTKGQVGYVHIPDMLSEGMNQFVEYFYPQIRKKGLIIDDRGNGGGNVSPIIIERLRRQMVMQQMWRNVPKAGPVPDKTLVGPKVMLLNQYSASDGDLFPYQFKTYHMGTLIGERSWGGVTGIGASLPFIDSGYLYKPQYGHFSANGKKWIIECHGVDPDIVVDDNPAEAYKGKDAQLDKAIDVILEQMKTYPYKILPNPPFPNKNK
jgi:tricorn protease